LVTDLVTVLVTAATADLRLLAASIFEASALGVVNRDLSSIGQLAEHRIQRREVGGRKELLRYFVVSPSTRSETRANGSAGPEVSVR